MHDRLPTLEPFLRRFHGIFAVSAAAAGLAIGCGGTGARQAPPAAPAAVPVTRAAPVAVATRVASSAPERGVRLPMGRLSLVVMTSRTASLFHATDQLSHWSPFSHPQYAKWLPRADAAPVAEALLARQRVLRSRLGWGKGLEDALYTDDPDVGHALDVAVGAGLLAATDAREEKEILEGMAPLLEVHLAEGSARATSLVDRLRESTPSFARLFDSWLVLADVPPPSSLEIVFVPSPGRGSGGGGANGKAIVVELPEEGSVDPTMTTVAHETIHAILRPRKAEMAAKAESCGHGLDTTTIGEGFAYATAPGLFSYGGTRRLEEGAERAEPGSAYRAFHEVALALRPALRAKLGRTAPSGEDFPALLDVICEAWKARSR